ncbi:serine hydrolase domain-containing protein [Plastoroseomonas arctica]|uniref:Beta-lactamase family protein n=1 Tax=Plastoroseomonas arctica TaxID=1509237 RepID=A0AAF1JZZ0_9PROT|nr:serine hydrolase domain-containing protein [Plastoroseomonas arctica]MBR0654663.1 beta-lactamase family protein [Plastoroseomonas arctica]
MRMLVLAAIGLLALPALAADPLPRGTPESLGFSPERLGRIRTTLEADIARGQLPGAVVAIARRGRLAYYEAFGHLDGARTRPMPIDAIFPIASMTKPLTGVAMLTLLEEGRLSIGDPITRFFPQLGNRQVAVDGNPERLVPATRPITLIDLARHTSGITYGARGTTALHRLYPPSSSGAAREFDAAGLITKLASLPLLYQPGSTWDYSLSIDVLGLVVEQVTEQRLGEVLEARVFRPLGMVDTGFLVPEASRARYATPLPTDPATRQPQQVEMGLVQPRFDCGGGCAVSTAHDYLRFAQMLLAGGRLGEARILSRSSVAEMTRDHMHAGIANNLTGTEGNMVNWGFGLTVAVRREGGSALLGNPGMFSWNGAYGTAMFVDPHEDLAVVFMAATPGLLRQYYRRVINALVYQALDD